MAWPIARGRLFHRVLLALCACMAMAVLGTILYVRLTGGAPPPPPPTDRFPAIGPVPLVPLVSAGIAILIAGISLAWYITKPLRLVQEATHRVAKGDLGVRLQPLMKGRTDEIADVARDFDAMVAQLQQLTESRQLLLHDISHELRSPLTRMQAAIGLLRQDPANAVEMIERIERESRRLDTLIGELLTLHRLEAAPATFAREPVDLVELLLEITDDAAFEAQATQRGVVLHADGDFLVEGNSELLYRAFENVVRNAVKFTPQGTEVEVRAAASLQGPEGRPECVVLVRDRGPGVPQDALETMFEPFVRIEGPVQVRGAGLGLTVARRAILLHGGSVAARLPADGGLEMEIRLPVASGDTARE